MQHIFGGTSFKEDVEQHSGDSGGLLGRLHENGVAGHQSRDRHATQDGQREVPRCDDGAGAAAFVDQRIVLPDVLTKSLLFKQLNGFAGVELAEVDGFAGFRIGITPAFSIFVNDHGGQFVAPSTHDGCSSGQNLRPNSWILVSPTRKRLVGGDQGLLGVVLGGVHGLMGHGGGVDGGLESGPNRFVGKIAWSFIHIRSVIANSFDSRSQKVSFGRAIQQCFTRIRLGVVDMR